VFGLMGHGLVRVRPGGETGAMEALERPLDPTATDQPRERRGRRARPTGDAEPAAGAIRPGMTGGAYRPLAVRDIERIFSTALDVLENIGIGESIPEILRYALPGGCTLGEDGRLRFPRSLVEDMMAVASRGFVRYGVDPALDLEISGERVYFCTSGEAVTILDYETQAFRPSRLVDLYDAARLVDRLSNIHQYGQPFIATEYSEQVYVHDINVAYAPLVATRKPFSISCATVGHVDDLVAMFDLVAGGEGRFLERPFCSIGGCPIVSPLRWGKDNAEVMVRTAELGLTTDIAIAPQAGATSPAALAGSLVQSLAETLACLVVVNLVNPGNPFDFGMWPFVSDLRTGAFTGGSGEEALLMAAVAQIANHYGLVSSVAAGMTDAKTMDAQAGYEKGITITAAALAGANQVAAYPGIVGSLMGQSFEGLVIDDDLIGNAQRVVRGIEVNDETLSYEVIAAAVAGPGHYLGSEQTLRLMRTEFQYPSIADRTTPGVWTERGSRTIYEQAHDRVREILGTHYPEYLDPKVDAQIRERFPIRLDPADMRPGNGRW
jgi:trimethylamine---corrinoid protein Co-methyltransferase